MIEEFEAREIVLHGHRICYRTAGEGPVVALIHGITGTSETWREVLPMLVEDHTVIAPDLLGHGESAKPRGDHSLGGGVAMQFAYQFPERCERLVLVSSGGLGREVHPMLRAAAIPGSELVLPFITSSTVLDAGAAVGRLMSRFGLEPAN